MSISVTPGDRLGAYEANGGGEETPQGKNFSVFVARGKLFWMLFRFAFLTIITLGIYRFWAKTKLRRYLWSVVEYDGDRFEYHGTAKELFLGFLIALAVLLPLGVLNGVLEALVFAEGGYEGLAILYSLTFLLVIMFLINFAVYRMRRYQLTRTSWRSVHFGLDGSAVKYALISILWTGLTAVTLGLAYPWMQAWQTRRMANNARVGNLNFSSSVSGWDIFKRYILFYGIYAVLLVTFFSQIVDIQRGTGRSPDSMILLFVAMGLFGLIGSIVLRVAIFRLSVNRTRLGGHAIRASFGAGPIVWSAILSTLVALLIYIAAITIAMGLMALLAGGSTAMFSDFGSDPMAAQQAIITAYIFVLPAILISALFAGAAGMAIFGVTVMRTIIPGIEVEHSEELDQIMQSETGGPKYGEGFADALDVGAF